MILLSYDTNDVFPLLIILQRSAATKIEWTKISTQLGLRGQTAAALNTFKKRNDDARRKVNLLSNIAQTVDFQHYRNTLGNTAVVDEIEQHFKSFKPATYDVNRQLKAIDAFEAQAVKNAEETKSKVDIELKDLEKALTNIETARPIEDMTAVRTYHDDMRLPSFHKNRCIDTTLHCRMILQSQDQISTSAQHRWCHKTSLLYQDTRYLLRSLPTPKI